MAPDIYWFDIIDSTNYEALRRIEGASDFSVYAAKFQTSGRGQKGTQWESAAEKNLTFSILIKPTLLKATDQFLVSQIVALGVTKYLKGFKLNATIKWPNDIYVDNKKICGILIEHYLSGANLSASIIGIGLNLNQKHFASDAPNPTSLSLEKGVDLDIYYELKQLLAIINSYYLRLNVKSYSLFKKEIEAQYKESLYKLNSFAFFQDVKTDEIFEAQILGVDKNACLIIEKRDGLKRSYAFKEIKFLLNHQ